VAQQCRLQVLVGQFLLLAFQETPLTLGTPNLYQEGKTTSKGIHERDTRYYDSVMYRSQVYRHNNDKKYVGFHDFCVRLSSMERDGHAGDEDDCERSPERGLIAKLLLDRLRQWKSWVAWLEAGCNLGGLLRTHINTY